jgi:chromosome segregation ATPase
MSEEHTQNMADSRSFEDRVFARFDSLDSGLDALHLRLDALDLRLDAVEARLEALESRVESLDSRLQSLEVESERRSFETKPIWERALALIEELRLGFDDFRKEVHEAFRDISRKFGVLGSDMIQLRADQTHLESRLSNLESKT